MQGRLFTLLAVLSLALCAASGYAWRRSYHRLDFGSHLFNGQTVEWLSDAGSIAIVTMTDLRAHSADAPDAYPLRKRDAGYILAFGPADLASSHRSITSLKRVAVALTRKAQYREALCVVDQILEIDPADDYALGVAPLLEDRWDFQMTHPPGTPWPSDDWMGPYIPSPHTPEPEPVSMPWTTWRRDSASAADASDAAYLHLIRDPARRWPGFHYVATNAPVFHGRGIVFPHWLLAAIFAILPARFAYVSLRGAKRARIGFCAQCGYDLRATRDRCPECGTAVTHAHSA